MSESIYTAKDENGVYDSVERTEAIATATVIIVTASGVSFPQLSRSMYGRLYVAAVCVRSTVNYVLVVLNQFLWIQVKRSVTDNKLINIIWKLQYNRYISR